MWKETDVAYLAGLIDGEGSVYVQQRMLGKSIDYFPRVQIINTDLVMMTWVHDTFGGNLYQKSRLAAPAHWKPQYEWYSTRKLLDALMPRLLPHLRAKRKQVEIMLTFRATFSKRESPVSAKTQAIRSHCMMQLKELNRRGLQN